MARVSLATSAAARSWPTARRWSDTIVLSAAAVYVLVAHIGPPVQAWVMFVFMLFYPGMPYARLLGVRNLLIEVTLAATLSLALDVIVAEAMVYAGHLSADFGVAVLVVIAIIGVGFQIRSWLSAGAARRSSR